MKSRIYLRLFIFLSLIGFAFGQTQVGGIISSNSTWSFSNSPYLVTGNILIQEGVTLTIEPGVIVKLQNDNVIVVKGELIARGTDGNEITFTSNESSPAAGDWGKIHFNDESVDASFIESSYNSGSILEHCIIEYATIGLDLDHSSPFVQYTEIRHNSEFGIITIQETSSLTPEPTFLWVNNCDIHHNRVGAKISKGAGFIDADILFDYNNIHNNGSDQCSSSNEAKCGGIFVNAGTISNNTIKNNTGINGNALEHPGAGVNASGGIISNNIISGNKFGFASVWFRDVEAVNNVISDSSGLAVIIEGPSDFTGNTIFRKVDDE